MPKKKPEKVSTGDDQIDGFINRCVAIMNEKNRDYRAGNPDFLGNFKMLSQYVNEPPMKVLGTFMYKHMTAIYSYIRTGGQNESEPIETRIADAINYLLLLYKMVIEDKKEKAAAVSRGKKK